MRRLKENTNELITTIQEAGIKNGWTEKTKKIMTELGLTEEDLECTKYMFKKGSKKRTETMFKDQQIKPGKNKSKVNYLSENTEWDVGKRPEYMNKLTRKQASIIFKARTRMLNVKENYKSKYTNNQCRACGRMKKPKNMYWRPAKHYMKKEQQK